jgi:hypothetical protein
MLRPFERLLTDEEVELARTQLLPAGRITVMFVDGRGILRKNDMGALALRVCPVGEP